MWGSGDVIVYNYDNGSTRISYEEMIQDANGVWGYWTADITTTDNVFKNSGLNSASLKIPLTVKEAYNLGESKTLKIKADWTGTGDIVENTYTYVQGGYSYKIKELRRDAIANVSINDGTTKRVFTSQEFLKKYNSKGVKINCGRPPLPKQAVRQFNFG